MAERAESAALRAAVADGSPLAVLTAVGDLLGKKPWPDDYEGLHDQYLVNLFDALGDETVASAVQLGNTVVPEMARFVSEFVHEMVPYAGDGSAEGVMLNAKYALKPVRFTNRISSA